MELTKRLMCCCSTNSSDLFGEKSKEKCAGGEPPLLLSPVELKMDDSAPEFVRRTGFLRETQRRSECFVCSVIRPVSLSLVLYSRGTDRRSDFCFIGRYRNASILERRRRSLHSQSFHADGVIIKKADLPATKEYQSGNNELYLCTYLNVQIDI